MMRITFYRLRLRSQLTQPRFLLSVQSVLQTVQMHTARCDTIIFEYYLHAVFLGCDCDESLPNANDFCPRKQVNPRRVDNIKILTFYWRNARNVNVSRKAASAIPTLSILMSSAPGMSSASTVNVSHSVNMDHFMRVETFSLLTRLWLRCQRR